MSSTPRFQSEKHANNCMLLEGTYPISRAGVSTWVRQLIEGIPDLAFSIVFLGSKPGANDTLVYKLLDDLVHLEVHFLYGRQVSNTIGEKYRDAPAGLDFNHYFWIVRGGHAYR